MVLFIMKPYTHTHILDEETVLLVQTTLFDGECECMRLARAEPESKYFLKEGVPRREAHWLNAMGPPRYLISMEN